MNIKPLTIAALLAISAPAFSESNPSSFLGEIVDPLELTDGATTNSVREIVEEMNNQIVQDAIESSMQDRIEMKPIGDLSDFMPTEMIQEMIKTTVPG